MNTKIKVTQQQREGVERNAYKEWCDICTEQGWNEEFQLVHLEGFLRDRSLFAEFAAYARQAADEENMQ